MIKADDFQVHLFYLFYVIFFYYIIYFTTIQYDIQMCTLCIKFRRIHCRFYIEIRSASTQSSRTYRYCENTVCVHSSLSKTQ